MIVKFLKNRLRKRERNKNYIDFRLNTKQKGWDLHHLLGSFIGGKKQNDFLLAEIPAIVHTVITVNRKPTEAEELDMLANSLEGIFDYVEHLEQELFKAKNLIHGYEQTTETIIELTNDQR